VGGRVEGVRAMFEERVGLFGSEAVRLQPFHSVVDARLTLLTYRRGTSGRSLPSPPSFLQDDEEQVVFIGFSSPAAHWMGQNLSYSLTFHLVESAFAFFLFSVLPLTPSLSPACRNVADSMPFSGLTFGDFGASFEKSLGRTAELSPEQEVRLFLFLFLDCLSLPRFRSYSPLSTCTSERNSRTTLYVRAFSSCSPSSQASLRRAFSVRASPFQVLTLSSKPPTSPPPPHIPSPTFATNPSPALLSSCSTGSKTSISSHRRWTKQSSG
jgi:hypothetical protein